MVGDLHADDDNPKRFEKIDAEIVDLIGEIYKSILKPERYIEVMAIWDRALEGNSQPADTIFDLLEEQLSNAIPLLESALKNSINQDELFARVKEQSRPCILLGANLMVVSANETGMQRFKLHEGDRVDLETLDPDTARQLQQLMQSPAIRPANDRELTVDPIPVQEVDGGLTILPFTRVGRDGFEADFLAAIRVIKIGAREQRYLLLSAMDLILSEDSSDIFAATFELTAAEISVVERLVSGMRIVEIAREQNIREDTVKKHLRSIRHKTRTPNTTALICLAASFAQLAKENGGQTFRRSRTKSVTNFADQTYVMPTQHKLVQTRYGLVECVDIGDVKAEPLIICHSSMIGFVLPTEFTQRLTENGYRVLIPYRAGYGMSDPMTGGFSLEKQAEMLLAFCDALHLDRVSLVGGTVGFAHALAVAELAPERVSGIVGVSAYLPVSKQTILPQMAPWQRVVLSTIGRNRRLAKFLILSGYNMFLRLGAERFFHQLIRHSKSDVAVLESGDVVSLLNLGIRVAAAQGIDAFMDDVGLIMSDWTGKVKAIQRPVHLIHGVDDSVFSPEVIDTFCKEYPHFSVQKLATAGQLMIYAQPIHLAGQVDEAIRKQQLIVDSAGMTRAKRSVG